MPLDEHPALICKQTRIAIAIAAGNCSNKRFALCRKRRAVADGIALVHAFDVGDVAFNLHCRCCRKILKLNLVRGVKAVGDNAAAHHIKTAAVKIHSSGRIVDVLYRDNDTCLLNARDEQIKLRLLFVGKALIGKVRTGKVRENALDFDTRQSRNFADFFEAFIARDKTDAVHTCIYLDVDTCFFAELYRNVGEHFGCFKLKNSEVNIIYYCRLKQLGKSVAEHEHRLFYSVFTKLYALFDRCNTVCVRTAILKRLCNRHSTVTVCISFENNHNLYLIAYPFLYGGDV